VGNGIIVQNGGLSSCDPISDYARCRGEGSCPEMISFSVAATGLGSFTGHYGMSSTGYVNRQSEKALLKATCV